MRETFSPPLPRGLSVSLWAGVLVEVAVACLWQEPDNRPLPARPPAHFAPVPQRWSSVPQTEPEGRSITIRAGADNGCHAALMVNGHRFRVLLDSGAVGVPLVFGSNMADDLGIDAGSLEFSNSYSSANGIGYEAYVRLPEITLAGWTLRDVPAVITQAPQSEVLFGAELLHQLNFTTGNGYCRLSMPIAAAHTTAARHRRRAWTAE